MHENHQREQYFFAPPSIQALADLVEPFDSPCCLGTPTIAQELQRRGTASRLLEIDSRFSGRAGYRRWDLYRPEDTGEDYGCILCDPPFNTVRLSQLFTALRVAARGRYRVPILLCHLAKRSLDIQATLAPFRLSPTELVLEYVSVKPTHEDRIILYSNFPIDAPQGTATPSR